MSEADRVPSPAAPPAVVAAAPEEKKGKEPEREKLPPIVSAGAGAAAVGAGRGPRGAPTAGREGVEGRPGTRVSSWYPRTHAGKNALAALPLAEIRVVPPGQPRSLREQHLPPSGNAGVAGSPGCFRLFFGWGWGHSLLGNDQHLGASIICWMRIRCQTGESRFSTELPALQALWKRIFPPLVRFSFPSPFGLNPLCGEFPLNCDLSFTVRVVGGWMPR